MPTPANITRTETQRSSGPAGTIIDVKPDQDPQSSHQSAVSLSNPLYIAPGNCDKPPITQTLPAREIFHEAQEALRPLVSSVHTEEELDNLLRRLNDLR